MLLQVRLRDWEQIFHTETCQFDILACEPSVRAEKQPERQERVNVLSSLLLWMAAESDRGPGINTQAPIHPLAVWSTLNSGRRVIAAEGGGDRRRGRREGGGTVTQEFHRGARDPWARHLYLPLPLSSQAGAPQHFLVLFFVLGAKPAESNRERESTSEPHTYLCWILMKRTAETKQN